jgi:DnaK suppressor protein
MRGTVSATWERGNATIRLEGFMAPTLSSEELTNIRQQLEQRYSQLVQGLCVNRQAILDATLRVSDDMADYAHAAHTQEVARTVGNGNRNELTDVLEAIRKIATGDYGTCEMCGDPISRARLLAIPSARHCVGCQSQAEQSTQTRSSRSTAKPSSTG